METVRAARWADAGRLAELWDAADAEIGVQRGGQRLVGDLSRPPQLDAAPAGASPDARLLDDPDRLLLVGCVDEVILGFTAAAVDRRPPAPVAVVDVVFVEADARRVGIADAMVDRVLAWAVEAGCVGVDAYALPGNRAAKAFFEGNRFVTRLLTMYRPLVPGAGPGPAVGGDDGGGGS